MNPAGASQRTSQAATLARSLRLPVTFSLNIDFFDLVSYNQDLQSANIDAIVSAYRYARGSDPSQSEIDLWLKSSQSSATDPHALVESLLQLNRTLDDAQLSIIIKKAFLQVRDILPNADETSYWIRQFRGTGRISYSSLVSDLQAKKDSRHDAIIKVYQSVRGANPSQSEIDTWIRSDGSRRLTRTFLKHSLLEALATRETSQLADIVQRAYLKGRGTPANADELAIWIEQIRNNRLGYSDILDSLIDRLKGWQFATIKSLVNRASLEGRGKSYSARDNSDWYVKLARFKGYGQVVEAFSLDSDRTINRAYSNVLNRLATEEELIVWRPFVRQNRSNEIAIANYLQFYPEAKYRQLLEKAAASGFKRWYFRIAALGAVTVRSALKGVHPRVFSTVKNYDPLVVALDVANKHNIEVFAWMTPFDDAGPQAVSPINEPGPGVGQSEFSYQHPEFQLQSRDGMSDPNWGVYSFGHPEVRQYMHQQVDELVAKYHSKGLKGFFFSDRTHSNMHLKKKHFGFNQPVIAEYERRYGNDPRQSYDLKLFSKVQGDFYTAFLEEISEKLHKKNLKFHVKASWSNYYLVAGRLGALYRNLFDTQTWTEKNLIDNLVIGGDAASGTSDEFIVDSFDTSSPINVRTNFPAGNNTVDRWISLFNWNLIDPSNARKSELGKAMGVSRPTIQKAVSEIVRSGVDGILFLEALVIDAYDDWEFLAGLTCRRDSGIDSDDDGKSDCEECGNSTVSIGCTAAHFNDNREAMIQYCQEARGSPPSPEEMASWEKRIKAGTLSKELLRQELLQATSERRTEELATIVQRAFIATFGTSAEMPVVNDWISQIRTRKIGYAAIVNALLPQVRQLPFSSLRTMVDSASKEARGISYIASDLDDLHIQAAHSGYDSAVQSFTREHAIWSQQHIDELIQQAFKNISGRSAQDLDLQILRPLVRKGAVTFGDVESYARQFR